MTLNVAGNPDEAGLANLRQDFGIFQGVSLGNLVFTDVNNNGLFDALTEAGVANIPVRLLTPAGALIATTTTDASGNYLFTGLVPGQYIVSITPPAGFTSSNGNGPTSTATGAFEPGISDNTNNADHGTIAGAAIQTAPITIGQPGSAANPDNAGFANLRQDFGIFAPTIIPVDPNIFSLGNLVFNDANNNGVRDGGEAPIAGAFVELLNSAGALLASQSTDANGNYLFGSLASGQYIVRVTTPAGFVSSNGNGPTSTAPGPFEPGISDNTDNADHGSIVSNFAQTGLITIFDLNSTSGTNPDGAGKANLRQDFGFFQPTVLTGSIGNLVFSDVNNNGVVDAGEAGIAGVTVTLLDSNGTAITTQTTDTNGNYLFTNLSPGTYTVRVTPPALFATSTGTNASPTGPFEPGLSDTTNNADHGTASGAFIQATVTLAAPGSAANPDNASLDNLRQDFGLYQPLQFGNTVWFDTNRNGVLEAGEPVAPGITVNLRANSGTGTILATVVTDSNGRYQFTNLLPGTYVAEIVPPAGVTSQSPTSPPLNTTDNLNIGSQVGATIQSAPFTLALGAAPLINGNTNPNNFVTGDFGLSQPQVAQVSGFVYLDPNVNGQFEGTERPIGGVTVTLVGNGITRTTTTDSRGFYQFTGLPPGSYTIRETQPNGILYDGLDTPGSLGGASPSNDTLTVTLIANDNGQNYNFGEIPPSGEFGYVWVDANFNCVRDPGEIGVAGVPITISGTAFAGTSLARPLTEADLIGGGSLTVFTDSTGRYDFTVLPPGTYSISRGGLPAAADAIYDDFCLQIGDPNGPTPGTGTNQFTGVIAAPTTIRGPLNFGLVPVSPVTPTDPSKQNFLGSSPTLGGVGPIAPPPTTIPPPGGPTQPAVSLNPTFNTTTGTPTNPAFVVTAGGAGLAPLVRVFDYGSGVEKFRFQAYESSFTGGVRTAVGDVNGDGVDDIVTATGVGGGPRIRVFSGVDGAVLTEFFAFESTFRGGVFVAVGDVDGDGFGDVVVGAEVGGGPRITTFSGRTGAQLNNFFAFDVNQRGGTRVGVGDFNGDGRADIVATTGAGVPTLVRIFDAVTLGTIREFAPFEAAFTGGVNLAVANFGGDATPDLILGAEVGGGPRVQVFDGATNATLANFFAFETTFTGGVRVGASDINGDGLADLVTTPGPGGASRVRILRAGDLQELENFFAFDPDFVGGAYVG